MKRMIFIRLWMTLCCIFMVSASAYAISAKVKRTWLEHDVQKNGVLGINVHVSFSVEGMRGLTGKVVAFFDKPQGVGLKDTNGRYCNTQGNVCCSGQFTPSYDNSTFNDYTLFIPISELHMSPGKQTYYCRVFLFYNGQLAHGEFVSFTGTGGSSPSPSVAQNSNNNNEGDRYYDINMGNGSQMQIWQHSDGSATIAMTSVCVICHGLKSCMVCHGAGGVMGYGGIWYPCTACCGTLKCKWCNGEGYQRLIKTWQPGEAEAFMQAHREVEQEYRNKHERRYQSNGQNYMDVIYYTPNMTGVPYPDEYCSQCQEWGQPHKHIKKRY